MIWNPLPALVGLLSYLSRDDWQRFARQTTDNRWSCRPFLPNLFAETPPPPNLLAIREVTKILDGYFVTKFSQGSIDSLSVAIVTSGDVLYEKNFGVLKANETNSPFTTSHDSYRIASISKLFTVLEGFILEQRGIISWYMDSTFITNRRADNQLRDDPVDKYLEDFRYRLDGFDPHRPQPTPEEAPITLFQLATHMSGMGRDWPPGSAAKWPYEASGGGPPPDNGRPFPTYEALFDDMPRHHLVSYPWTYPSYSNTGVGVLGLALAAASRVADGHDSVIAHADLLQRDIFGPMGLNGSHFLATERNKNSVVVSSVVPNTVVSK